VGFSNPTDFTIEINDSGFNLTNNVTSVIEPDILAILIAWFTGHVRGAGNILGSVLLLDLKGGYRMRLIILCSLAVAIYCQPVYAISIWMIFGKNLLFPI